MEKYRDKPELTGYSSFVYFLYLTDLLLTMVMSGSGCVSVPELHLFPCTESGFIFRCLVPVMLLIIIGIMYRGCSTVQGMIIRRLLFLSGLICFLRLCINVFLITYYIMILAIN